MMAGKDRLVKEITMTDIVEYLKTHYDTAAPKTYNSQIQYLRTFFNRCKAKAQRYILENPAEDIPLKAEAWKEPEYLSVDDVRKLTVCLWKHREEDPHFILTVHSDKRSSMAIMLPSVFIWITRSRP